MTEQSSYSLLIDKLDQFIRKYYTNKIIKGTLISVALCIGLFLLYSFLEHEFYLSQIGRKSLFFSYILVFLGSVGYWVIMPTLRYFRLGKVISHDQAATILGQHFGDVEDKLLNILQLKRDLSTMEQKELIEASINQKANQIKIIPFKKAIDLKENKRYLRYALPPMLLLLFLLFAAPSLITDSTYRIINNDEDFEREAPFHFIIDNEDLSVVQYSDYELSVKIEGDQLPDEVFIEVDNYEYRLNKQSPNQFSYLFSNVRKDVNFEVYSGKYRGEENVLSVLPKPKIVDFSVYANYPSYTGRKDETLANSGDLSVPIGTKLLWKFNVQSTDNVEMKFGGGETIALAKEGSASFVHNKQIRKDEDYQVRLSNKKVPQGDSVAFFIRSVEDRYPEISVDVLQDSAEANIYYFVGNAADDYGLTKMNFVSERLSASGSVMDQKESPIKFAIATQISYDHILNIQEFDMKPGEKLNFYFEVYDNDQVNGSKSSRTSVMSHRKKSLEEVEEIEDENEEEIKSKLDESIDEAKDIQKALEKLRESLLQKDKPTWQDKKELEKLLERQNDLEEQMKEAKEAHQENMKNQEEFMNLSPEMQEKQERLNQLFEELVSQEMKDMMEKIKQLMDEMNKEQTLQMMEEFKTDQETMKQEMERLEELYKQLEVEKEMDEALDKLGELAKELEDLSEETKEQEKSEELESDEKAGSEKEEESSKEETGEENSKKEEKKDDSEKEKSKEDLEKKQEEINKEFEKLKEDMKDMMKKNDELEFPKDIPEDAPEQMEEIQEQLEESLQQMKQEEMKDASKSQKSAAGKMQQMAGAMQAEMEAGEQEQAEEDLETLRQLLENLVTLSFDQEILVTSVNRTVVNTPKYVSLVQEQMKVKDDFKVVEDTLVALSLRQPKLETFVLEKVGEVKTYLKSGLRELEDRKKPEANMSQRTTMKNLNDLALMLSETMEQMQQEMSGMMAGSQMCQKPGNKPGKKGGKNGKTPSDKISKGQEEMNDALQKMMQTQKQGNQNSAKDFAGAAAKQAALRKALQEMAKGQQEQGKGASGELQQIMDEMDKQEIDLVNKRLDNELMTRQQNIMTRLLEAEKAQREREYDNKRKSEEGQDVKRQLPPSLERYIKERKSQLEQFKYVSPELTPHYKKLVEDYYKKLKRA